MKNSAGNLDFILTFLFTSPQVPNQSCHYSVFWGVAVEHPRSLTLLVKTLFLDLCSS